MLTMLTAFGKHLMTSLQIQRCHECTTTIRGGTFLPVPYWFSSVTRKLISASCHKAGDQHSYHTSTTSMPFCCHDQKRKQNAEVNRTSWLKRLPDISDPRHFGSVPKATHETPQTQCQVCKVTSVIETVAHTTAIIG